MGQLSYNSIISEAGLLAGRDDLTTRAAVWLKAWLRSNYAAFPWPFLQRTASGIALAAGTTALSVGAASGGITPEIQKILDPVWVYNSAYTAKSKAHIRRLTGGDSHESQFDSALGRGLPVEFKVRADASVWGKWSLIPFPVPNAAYLLTLDYIEMPADYSSGGAFPLYPNDRTLIQAVMVEILKYENGVDDAGFQSALEVLGAMVIDDRVKYGTVPGTNDTIQLDSSVFK